MAELFILKSGKLPEKDMLLLSTKEMKEKQNLFTNIDNLVLKELHLQLNSMKFSKVTVQLRESDGLKYLPLVLSKAEVKRLLVEQEDVSPQVVSVLCTIYPDKSSKLRKALMTRQSIQEVLNE